VNPIPAVFLFALAALLAASAVAAPERRSSGDAAAVRDAPLPPELAKTFERYARAWADGDWGRLFDLNDPEGQKLAIKEFGSRDAWMEHQAKALKDRILSVERKAVWRVGEASFTFAISTKVRRPDKREETVGGFATFEWIDGKWYLVEPIIPGAAQAAPPQPGGR
jgi:hypothetical protein